MQLDSLKKDIDRLQRKFGDPSLMPIYGAGQLNNPALMFIFMNPTGRNISSQKSWQGLRAPWIGTKNVWKLFFKLKLISSKNYNLIKSYKPRNWDYSFASRLYSELAGKKVYITNLAKCTQKDARHLKDNIFKKYSGILKREILSIRPKKIVTFGNQVSSIVLDKKISVSRYNNLEAEPLKINDEFFNVYPIYYPVGQGMRNMPIAIKKINCLLSSKIV